MSVPCTQTTVPKSMRNNTNGSELQGTQVPKPSAALITCTGLQYLKCQAGRKCMSPHTVDRHADSTDVSSESRIACMSQNTRLEVYGHYVPGNGLAAKGIKAVAQDRPRQRPSQVVLGLKGEPRDIGFFSTILSVLS